MEFLLAPIDPSRAHDVGFAISWHGRIMVLAWGVLAPLAVIVARFFKVLPGQDWPREVDSQVWWRTHWGGHTVVTVLTVAAIALIWRGAGPMTVHNWLGYVILAFLAVQVLLGLTRGSKGGPTDIDMRGHHYDMTPWRRMFEMCHKALGYGVLALAAATILTGLWKANAPVWMWIAICLWWAALVIAFMTLQRRGMAVCTYQAIWGDDPGHPGNQLPPPGWGVRRMSDDRKGRSDVRSD